MQKHTDPPPACLAAFTAPSPPLVLLVPLLCSFVVPLPPSRPPFHAAATPRATVRRRACVNSWSSPSSRHTRVLLLLTPVAAAAARGLQLGHLLCVAKHLKRGRPALHHQRLQLGRQLAVVVLRKPRQRGAVGAEGRLQLGTSSSSSSRGGVSELQPAQRARLPLARLLPLQTARPSQTRCTRGASWTLGRHQAHQTPPPLAVLGGAACQLG